MDGGPGPALGRPVPSRRVSHHSPPAIHSSFSQPPACQCPTARRTVCTQKRSGSPSLPRLPPSRETCARARTLFHPGESRIAYPPPLYPFLVSCLSLSSPLRFRRSRSAVIFLFVLLPDGTIPASSSSSFSIFTALRYRSCWFSFFSSLLDFVFFFHPLLLLLLFLFLVRHPNLPGALFLFSPPVTLKTHKRRLSFLSLLFAPTLSFSLSLSVGWRSACLTSRRPTSTPSTVPPTPTGFCLRWERDGPFVPSRSLGSSRARCAHCRAVPGSLFLAPE